MPLRSPVRVSHYTATSALGAGKVAHDRAFRAHRSGLRPVEPADFGSTPTSTPPDPALVTWVGRVDGLQDALPSQWARWDCRNNRLAWLGLQNDGFEAAVRAATERYGAHRIAVVLGSSTASIGATESAYQQWAAEGMFPPQPDNNALHTMHSLAAFVQEALNLTGPCHSVSTACSSSAKVFASGERILALGLADAVVVGGVDSLCGSVLFGFNALQLVSPEPCRPFDTQRFGINMGEAAGFALLERGSNGLQLLGCGESSDAHHLSAPQPQGLGAIAALERALDRAGIQAADVDYLHAHGTATPMNDAVEASVIAQRFHPRTRVSSTKGQTGHTLGAAGILGAVFSLMAIESGLLPGTAGTQTPEDNMAPFLLLQPTEQRIRNAVCHSFGFGGSNAVLVFGLPGAAP